jgi:hypothetical protein
MESILKLLADPAWWFTALLAGVMASVIASYVRDFISIQGKKASRSFAETCRLMRKGVAIETALFADNPHLIALTYLRSIIRFLLLFVSVVIFASLRELAAHSVEGGRVVTATYVYGITAFAVAAIIGYWGAAAFGGLIIPTKAFAIYKAKCDNEQEKLLRELER